MNANSRPFRGTIVAVLLLTGALSATPGRAVDLDALDMQVTQAIQDVNQSTRLVAGKSTVVLVRAKSDGATVQNVSTRLAVFRIAPYSFLGTLDATNTGVVASPQWTNISRLFRFDIPKAWTTGTVQFISVVDFPDTIDESDENNNAVFRQVIFEDTPPVRLRVFGVTYPTGMPPREVDYTRIASWMRRGFPTSALSMQKRTMPTGIAWGNDVCNCTKSNGNCVGMTSGTCNNAAFRTCYSDTDCGCGWLNEMLDQSRKTEAAQNGDEFEPDRRWVALVHDSGGFMRGCSPGLETKTAAGPTGTPVMGDFTGWDDDNSYGDWYTAHELGHAYGRPHAACCGAAAKMGDPVFPIPGCAITPDEATEVGYENNLMPLTYGDNYTDVMSYCSNQWMSEYTFEAILDRLQFENGEPLPPLSPVQNIALVVGNANLDLDVAQLTSVLIMNDVRVRMPSVVSDFHLVLKDGTGMDLVRQPVKMAETSDDRDFAPFAERIGMPADRHAVFSAYVPLPAMPVGSIELQRLGVPIASRTVSVNPPSVTVLAPNGGESLGRTVTVQWSASDPDMDPLLATVFYSTDDGSTWKTVAGPLDGSSVDVDLDGLPGSEFVRFRVMVSDGFLTAQDDSDDVATVAEGVPTVFIASPSDGTAFEADASVQFEGLANDPEDGDLADGSLEWSSDRQGFLGNGESLVVDSLAPGTHVVTLTATDSDGDSASATVTIVKGDASADDCPAVPRDDCDVAQKSSLKMTDKLGPDPVRQLLFKFQRGTPVRDSTAFGNPVASTTHTLCLYEAGVLREALVIPSSATLWKATGTKGFRFTDPAATAIGKANLKAGATGTPAATSLKVKGKGTDLPGVPMPLGLPVTVHLVNDANTICYGAEFGPGRVSKNEPGAFRAK